MTSAQEEEFRKLAQREARFGPDLAQQRADEARKAEVKANYLADFKKYGGNVSTGGSWSIHYNNDTRENQRFKRLVDGTRYSLDQFITYAIHVAKSNAGALDFSAPDPSRRGQLSTFRLALWTLWGADYNGMTIAGAVTPDGIDVFHAGPGS